MTLDIYQVDAFSRGPFTGNPAAVVPLDSWLPDTVMQNIAEENNLAETAFFVRDKESFHIRWFTPTVEVQLCGHATLASAYVLFEILNWPNHFVNFNSKSGHLSVLKKGDVLTLDFPTDELKEVEIKNTAIPEALGVEVKEMFKGRDDYLCIVANRQIVESINPDFAKLRNDEARGTLVSSEGDGEFDFVSRGFFPQSGIDEDPATGSAHTTLTPYWSRKLNKKELSACQLSARKGFFECADKGERTLISGRARLYLSGKIMI